MVAPARSQAAGAAAVPTASATNTVASVKPPRRSMTRATSPVASPALPSRAALPPPRLSQALRPSGESSATGSSSASCGMDDAPSLTELPVPAPLSQKSCPVPGGRCRRPSCPRISTRQHGNTHSAPSAGTIISVAVASARRRGSDGVPSGDSVCRNAGLASSRKFEKETATSNAVQVPRLDMHLLASRHHGDNCTTISDATGDVVPNLPLNDCLLQAPSELCVEQAEPEPLAPLGFPQDFGGPDEHDPKATLGSSASTVAGSAADSAAGSAAASADGSPRLSPELYAAFSPPLSARLPGGPMPLPVVRSDSHRLPGGPMPLPVVRSDSHCCIVRESSRETYSGYSSSVSPPMSPCDSVVRLSSVTSQVRLQSGTLINLPAIPESSPGGRCPEQVVVKVVDCTAPVSPHLRHEQPVYVTPPPELTAFYQSLPAGMSSADSTFLGVTHAAPRPSARLGGGPAARTRRQPSCLSPSSAGSIDVVQVMEASAAPVFTSPPGPRRATSPVSSQQAGSLVSLCLGHHEDGVQSTTRIHQSQPPQHQSQRWAARVPGPIVTRSSSGCASTAIPIKEMPAVRLTTQPTSTLSHSKSVPARCWESAPQATAFTARSRGPSPAMSPAPSPAPSPPPSAPSSPLLLVRPTRFAKEFWVAMPMRTIRTSQMAVNAGHSCAPCALHHERLNCQHG